MSGELIQVFSRNFVSMAKSFSGVNTGIVLSSYSSISLPSVSSLRTSMLFTGVSSMRLPSEFSGVLRVIAVMEMSRISYRS